MSKHANLLNGIKFSKITLGNGREQRVPEKYKELSSQAAVIRAMIKDNFTKMQISIILDIRYQQVRNQLLQSKEK